MPDLYLAALLLAGLAVFQALVWGLPSFPRTRVFLVTLLVLGLLPLVALPFVMQRDAEADTTTLWAMRNSALAAVCWVIGIAAAVEGVRRERRGGWAGWQRGTTVMNLIRELSPAPPEFGSAVRAQFWMEWKRNCRLPLLVWTLLVWVLLGASCFCSILKKSFIITNVAEGINLLTSIGLLGCAAIMGLNFARDGSSRKLALSSFTATRPVHTGSLLTAKLLAGLAAWILAAAILAVSAWAILAAGSFGRVVTPNDLGKLADYGFILFMLPISLHIFVGILPLCLSGRIPGFPWSLLPLLLIYGGFFNALVWLGDLDRREVHGLLFGLLTVAVFLKLVTAFWGFRRALGLRLVSARFVAGYVAFWLLGTAILLLLVWNNLEKADWAADTIWLIPATVAVVPLARIALSPLALAMNRHR